MPTWSATTTGHRRNGVAAGIIDAWNDAYDAASGLVTLGLSDTITLEVGGVKARIHPAAGGRESDIKAALEIIETARTDLVGVLSAPDDQAD